MFFPSPSTSPLSMVNSQRSSKFWITVTATPLYFFQQTSSHACCKCFQWLPLQGWCRWSRAGGENELINEVEITFLCEGNKKKWNWKTHLFAFLFASVTSETSNGVLFVMKTITNEVHDAFNFWDFSSTNTGYLVQQKIHHSISPFTHECGRNTFQCNEKSIHERDFFLAFLLAQDHPLEQLNSIWCSCRLVQNRLENVFSSCPWITVTCTAQRHHCHTS